MIFFISCILTPSPAFAGKAISITQHNIWADNDTAAWTIHTPAPGWIIDHVADPIEDEVGVGLMRSREEQDSILKYERPLPVDPKRFSVAAIMYQRNSLPGSLPMVSTQMGLLAFKIHF